MDIVQEFITRPDSYMKSLGVRAKRETSPTGFRVFPLPFIGAEMGIKYTVVPTPYGDLRGGEAYLHIDDLQSLVPQAQSKMVKLHAKFEPKVYETFLDVEINYQLEHKTGHGTEEGSFKVSAIKRIEDHTLLNGRVEKGWKFNVKSERVPFVPLPFVLTPFNPIIPESISDVDFEVMMGMNDDPYAGGFSGKYVNSETGDDFRWSVKYLPPRVSMEGGKIIVTIGDVTHTLAIEGKWHGMDYTVDLKANIMGMPFTGKMLFKILGDKREVFERREAALQFSANIEKGAETFLKLSGKLLGWDGMMEWNRMRLKYNVKHTGTGIMEVLREADKVTIKVGSYKVVVWLHPYVHKLEAFKNNVPMWSYQFNKEVDMNPGTYELTLTSEMTLNSASKLHAFLAPSPFGAFQQRSNKLKIFVDKNNRNFIFPKFRIEWEVERDGVRLIDIKADTIGSPYSFSVSIPKLFEGQVFEGVAIAENPVTLTIDHQAPAGSSTRSLVIETK